MGFYITDQTQDRGPRAAAPPWGPKPARGPIREVISGYRFYNPDLGRWINRDPIGERGSINQYCFTGNSPLNIFDILGMLPPEEVYRLIQGLYDVENKCPCLNTEGAIEYLMGLMLGDDFEEFDDVVEGLNSATSDLQTIPETVNSYNELVDWVDDVYPDGNAPFDIDELQNMNIDMINKELSKLSKLSQAAQGAQVLLDMFENGQKTGAQVATEFANTLAFASSFNKISGLNPMFDFYVSAVEEMAEALGKIEDELFKKDVKGFIERYDCTEMAIFNPTIGQGGETMKKVWKILYDY